MRRCIYCEKLFVAKDEHEHFCSEQCRHDSKVYADFEKTHLLKVCPQCSNEFWTLRRKEGKFCNKQCYSERRIAERLKSSVLSNDGTTTVKIKKPVINRKDKYCKVCGNIIGDDRSHNSKTCSAKCAERLRRTQYSASMSRKRKDPKPDSQSLEDVVVLCKKLNIDYSKYQFLMYTGQLNEFMREKGVR